MDFKTDLALVTGPVGWLGSRLVEALAHGLEDVGTAPGLRIRCLALPHEDISALEAVSDRVEVLRGDLTNPEDCARLCDGAKGAVVFHTAGMIHPKRRREFYDVNVGGSVNLMEAATAAGARRAVMVSSNSPCGCNPHPDHLFDEDSRFNPYMHYGRSKMFMEQAIAKHQARGQLETVIIRAPWFYGPNQPPRQSLFFRMIRDGKAPIVGGGENRRSMAYIDNLCQGLMLAGSVDAANGRVYWIADERPYTMNEVIDTVERLLETEFGQVCKHKRMKLPGFASDIAWLVDKTIQGVGLYHQKFHVLSEMKRSIACSVERAKSELGYNPRIGLEEGMRRSLKWTFEKQGGLD